VLKWGSVCSGASGSDSAINEGGEEAHRGGILSSASVMGGAEAAAGAVARARRLPELRVGLHLVLVDGRPVLPIGKVPGLVRGDEFDRNLVRAAVRFFGIPRVRQELAREIRAQFETFQATGLPLDHVNAHKHMQLHPTVTALIIEIGRDYDMRAVRVPSEPVEILRRAFPDERYRGPAHRPWIQALRRRLKGAGLIINDHVFGLAWSGGMVEERVLGLLPHLPNGLSEIYFHPASAQNQRLSAAMPGYGHRDELDALLSPRVRRLIAQSTIRLASYAEL
jgi:chitin disaccharide deacetylase